MFLHFYIFSYSIEANGELVVPKVHSQNEGWYHCRKTENGQTEEYGSHLKIACMCKSVISEILIKLV